MTTSAANMPLLFAVAVVLTAGGPLFGLPPEKTGQPFDSPLIFPEHVEQPTERPAPTLRFRRILAPLDRMEDWPTAGGKYMPMDAAEFERLVNLLSSPEEWKRPPAASIATARYEARLVGDRLIGHAYWDVVLARDGPAALPLEPCGAAVTAARWQSADAGGSSPPDEHKDAAPAAMGLRADDRLALLVERSGRLEFDWSLAARRDSGDAALFAFEMPPAAANGLSLDLPEDYTPSVDRGMVLDSEASAAETRRWLIELPRRGRINLRVAPADAPVGRPLALLRESRTYDCSPRGLDVAAQWKLKAHNEPLETISVLLDPGLLLVSAQLGETAVPWSIDSVADGGETRVVLRLPEPIRDAERTLRLAAIGPVVLGRAWRLPRIRAEGLFWQEGNLSMLTPAPLSADRVEPLECVQTAAGPLSAPREGRSAQFQCFDPGATVEVVLARRPTTARLLSIAEIELGSNSASARIAAELHVAGGARSAFSADLAPHWTVDSVDSSPAGNVADWAVAPSPDGRRRLIVSLARAIGPNGSGRLEIVCSRRFERENEKLRQADLAPLDFSEIDRARQLTAVRPVFGRILDITGGEQLSCLCIDDLTEAELALCTWLPFDLLLDSGVRAETLAVGLRPPRVEAPATERGDAPADAALPDATAPAAWVWNQRLESWYQDDSAARHLAVYEIRNIGRGRLILTLPPEVKVEHVRGAWIDGEPAAWQAIGGDRVSLNLPADKTDLRAAIEWTTAEPRLGVYGKLRAVPPEPDSPVLARQWIVRLPPGREIADPLGGEPTAAVPQGWTAWRIDFSEPLPPELRYICRDSFRLFGVVAFLLVVAAGCRRRVADAENGRATRFALAALALFSAAAALLPDAFAAPAWGGAIGAAFCLAWRLPKHSQARAIEPPRRPRSASDSTLTMASPFEPLVLLIILALCGAAFGGAADRENARDEPVYRVIVPINADREPTGGRVFLPDEFYRQLHRLAASADKPPAWMIVGAEYHGTLSRDPSGGRIAAGNIRAKYDLHVFEPGVRVRLPLVSEGSAFIAGSVRLDGRAIETVRTAGSVPSIEIAEAGQYRLEYSLRPAARSSGGAAGFELSLPRVPAARFELALPDGAPSVEVVSARGGVQLDETARRLSAELGAIDRLIVQWPEEGSPGGAGRAAEIEQLTWLKVQPGSVLAAVKFNFHAVEGRVQQMRLSVDSRLRLLPIAGDNPPAVQLGPETGAWRTVALRWPRPLPPETTLALTFLLGGASGVGNVPLPKIELLDFTPGINWTAVAVDPALDYDQQHQIPLEPVAAADFLRGWGQPDMAPQFAFRTPSSPNGWKLSTRPHQPRGTVEQSLALGFDENRVEAAFDAAISVASGYVFQHRLTAPSELKVESVSVVENGMEMAQRWSRGDDGTIVVFLNGPASAAQKLSVRGSLPLDMDRPWPLPEFRVERCDLHTARIHLFRRPGVSLDVRGEEGEQLILDDVAAGTRFDAPHQGFGRLARTIRWDGVGRPPAEVLIAPNRPRIAAKATLRLKDDGRAWSADADIGLEVAGGIVDEIALRAPTPWNGPYRADKPGDLSTREIPGWGRCLVFRPAEPVSADYSLTVSGPLEPSGEGRVCLPDIRPIGVDAASISVELPRRAGKRIYRWQTAGLQLAEQAAGRRGPSDLDNRQSPAGVGRYTVAGESFRACLESIEGGEAAVELADVALSWSADGLLRGAARLDLDPGGKAELSLRLPAECELIGASSAGRPIESSRTDDGLWQMRMHSSDAPQSLEIVFSGRVPAAGSLRLDAPAPDGAPVKRVRWTIAIPAGRIITAPQSAAAAEPWTPDDLLLRAIGGAETPALQYESPPGETTLTLDCRSPGPSRLPRYTAAAVALAALGLLVLRRKR